MSDTQDDARDSRGSTQSDRASDAARADFQHRFATGGARVNRQYARTRAALGSGRHRAER